MLKLISVSHSAFAPWSHETPGSHLSMWFRLRSAPEAEVVACNILQNWVNASYAFKSVNLTLVPPIIQNIQHHTSNLSQSQLLFTFGPCYRKRANQSFSSMVPLGMPVAPSNEKWRSEGRLNVWWKELATVCSNLWSYNLLVPFELPISYSPKK